MREVYQAIYNKYNTSTGASLRALSSSMYVGTAPADTTGEYIVLTSPAGDTTRSMDAQSNGATYDNILIDVHVWSDKANSSNAWQVVEAYKALYDDVALTTSGYTTYASERLSPGIELEDIDNEGLEGWQITIPYRYELGK